jgi:DNA-binding transcriptional ArsR family regulator
VDVFEALADPIRRDLLVAMTSGSKRVVDLAAGQLVSRPAVSRHLRLLFEAGLVDVQDHGRERHYRLRRQPLIAVQALLERLAESRVPDPLTVNALDALDTEVRRTQRDRRRSVGTGQSVTNALPPVSGKDTA